MHPAKTTKLCEIALHTSDRFAVVPFAHGDIAPHDHNCFELAYVTRGKAVQQIEEKTQALHCGNYYFIDRGSCHSYRQCEDFHLINCLFFPDIIDPTLRDCRSFHQLMQFCLIRYYKIDSTCEPRNHIFFDSDGSILRTLRSMQEEYRTRDIGYEAVCRSCLQEILVLSMRMFVRESPFLSPEKWKKSALTQELMDYFAQHYTDKAVLANFCMQFHYCEAYVSRRFKQETGTTPLQYLQRLRIRKSCELLTGSNLSISEIAHRTGYDDLKHYHDMFRRFTGLSPSSFRKLGKSSLP